eukprot:3282196-Rhodomonas_salina.1
MARACWDAVTETFSAPCDTDQSTTRVAGGAASWAIDTLGKNGVFTATDSCTHTIGTSNEWWHVDLGTAMPVHRLLIWNRNVVPERLAGFQVWVTDSASPAFTDTYVWIYLPGSYEILTLCEVEVYEVAASAWAGNCDAVAACANTA